MRGLAAGLLIAFSLLLSSCARVPDGSLPADPCCVWTERFVPGLVAALEPCAPVLGRVAALVRWRPGYLSVQPESAEAILRQLRPLDIVLVSNKGRLTGSTIPGLFGHAAIHIGTERELDDRGLWSAVVEPDHREAIRRGDIFLEADHRGVHFSRAGSALETDRVLVLRPMLSTARQKQVLREYLASVGTPFDFHFDADTKDSLFCTELVRRALPEARLKAHRVYGRNLILPDEIARSALDGNPVLRPHLYVIGSAAGWRIEPTRRARDDIDRYWAAAWR
jgi:hypothetical protein